MVERISIESFTDKILTVILFFILYLFICFFRLSLFPHPLFHLVQINFVGEKGGLLKRQAWMKCTALSFKVHCILAATAKLDNEMNGGKISPLENRWSPNLNPSVVGHSLYHSGSPEKCTLCSSAQRSKSSARRTLSSIPLVHCGGLLTWTVSIS